MASSSRRKQDEKHLKILRELGSQTHNRTCFDCHQRGTTYINMTVGSFVCTSCSGILRGLNPPHRVKSISMASFTPEEIEQIKSKGNQYCQAVWLGLYDAKANPFPDTKDEHKIRDFMITKYEKKRFYIDPVVALKNMPPQTSSANSSNASSPSGESAKTAPTVNSSVSRPNVSASQCVRDRWKERKPVLPPLKIVPPDTTMPTIRTKSSGSVSGALTNTSSGSKNSTPKSSASLDLLADLGSQSASSVNSNDPFASPTSTQAPTNSISQPSFANFENANIFTNTASTTSSNKSTPSGPPPHTFSNSPLTPLAPGASSSSSLPNSSSANHTTPAGSSQPQQDRYAALKDLDEEFKTQKETETVTSNGGGGSWTIPNGSHNSSGVFNGGNSVFGSPGTSNNVFPSGLVNGGSSGNISGNGVFGTPPTNGGGSAWANFSGANPFSGSSNGTGSPWVNGGNSFGSTNHPQQGFGSVVQPNPFGTTPDPNFNQFGSSAPINGTSPNNGAWANFNQQPQSTKMQWMNSNSSANPFMAAAPQMPSSGTSYNPFL